MFLAGLAFLKYRYYSEEPGKPLGAVGGVVVCEICRWGETCGLSQVSQPLDEARVWELWLCWQPVLGSKTVMHIIHFK